MSDTKEKKPEGEPQKAPEKTPEQLELDKQRKERKKQQQLAKKKKAEAKKKAAEAKKLAAANKTKKKKEDAIRLRREYINKTVPGEKKDLTDFPDTYDPPQVESAWYDWWQKLGVFKPEYIKEPTGQFVMVIPPPNVTGSLHIGHALTNAVQDALCRWHRMSGRRVLWVPGTDHAGIATQTVVEKKLMREEKKTRHDLGREEFVKKVWEWKQKYGDRITTQLKRLGSSLDWDREEFTMSDKLSKAVQEAFVRFHDEGIIYRDLRLVNWSCALNTAISDVEVDEESIEEITKKSFPGTKYPIQVGAIWEFAYKVKDSDEEIVVATTRPETMLGDVAVAVHPDDKFKHLIGKTLVHPFLPGHEMPIIGDGILVDKTKGTGAVKITPAHDFNDFSCGKRNGLKCDLNILNDDGTLNELCAQFSGMPRLEARKAVIKALDELGLYKGVKPHKMILKKCSRSGDYIEPLLKPQWWVNCKKMAKDAVDAVENGDLEILPPNHVATWNRWLGDIRDWCISRQLWWGHRIPAYLVTVEGKDAPDATNGENWVSGRSLEEATAKAVKKFGTDKLKLEQDPDVLDTWFSSGLFPFSTLGWPEKTKDLEEFYPTQLLETGHDILFFWVARMVMMGQKLTGQLPFKQIYLHAMVRDAQGRKMSKSLGNVIDPIDVIEGITLQGLHDTLNNGNLPEKEIKIAKEGQKKSYPKGISECGTDALRFALCAYTSQGRAINLDIKRVVAYRNFCNKIWNSVKLGLEFCGADFKPSDSAPTTANTLINKWIMSKLNNAAQEAGEGWKSYEFPQATTASYNFWLYEFCGIYLEAIKPLMYSKDAKDAEAQNETKQTLYTCMEEALRLFHPFMPFVTEELWQRLPKRSTEKSVSISVAAYPIYIKERAQPEIEASMKHIMESVVAVRALRAEYGLKLRKPATPLVISCHSEEIKTKYEQFHDIVQVLSYSADITIALDAAVPAGAAVTVPNPDLDLCVVLKGLVNLEGELKRIDKILQKVQKQVDGIKKKQSSQNYIDRVPQRVKDNDNKKLEDLTKELENTTKQRKNFEALQ